MKLENKKVLVVGTGISGIAATELLIGKGVQATLFDGNKDLDLNKLYERAPKLKEVPIILGELGDKIKEFDVAVLSPGVPTDLPFVNEMRVMPGRYVKLVNGYTVRMAEEEFEFRQL